MKNPEIKERLVFIVFLFCNIALSIHCVTSAVREQANKVKTTYANEKDSEKTKSFNTISEIQALYSQNPLIMKFSVRSKNLCLKLYVLGAYYHANSLKECTESDKDAKEIKFFKGKFLLNAYSNSIDVMSHSDYPELLFFQIEYKRKSHLDIYKIDKTGNYYFQNLNKEQITKYSLLFQKESSKANIYKSPTLLFIYHSSDGLQYPQLVGLIEEHSNEKRQLIVKLDWDIDRVKDEKEFQQLFWLLSTPVAVGIDIITFPLQVAVYTIGIIIYLMAK